MFSMMYPGTGGSRLRDEGCEWSHPS